MGLPHFCLADHSDLSSSPQQSHSVVGLHTVKLPSEPKKAGKQAWEGKNGKKTRGGSYKANSDTIIQLFFLFSAVYRCQGVYQKDTLFCHLRELLI